jgi:NMD protein affecting ribosome stability and mRNA decay
MARLCIECGKKSLGGWVCDACYTRAQTDTVFHDALEQKLKEAATTTNNFPQDTDR